MPPAPMVSAPAVSALTDHLGFWMRQVSNHVSGQFAARLAAQGVSVVEWVLLRELFGAGAVAQIRLAARLGLTRGAVTKLADRLEARGLIARQADAADGRVQALTLTDQGAALVPVLAALADANDAACFAALSPQDRTHLVTILQDLARSLGLETPPVQ